MKCVPSYKPPKPYPGDMARLIQIRAEIKAACGRGNDQA